MRSFLVDHVESILACYFFVAFPGTFAIEDLILDSPYETVFQIGRLTQILSWILFTRLAMMQADKYGKTMIPMSELSILSKH